MVLSLLRRTVDERRKRPRTPLEASFQVTPLKPDGTPDWAETYEAMSRIEIGRSSSAIAVHLRLDVVEQGDLVPGRRQGIGEVGPDEAGAAGDQDALAHRVLSAASAGPPVNEKYTSTSGTWSART